MASSSPAAGMSPGFTNSLRTSFREMDVEYLEQRARIWIESVLNETLPASEKLGSILADGEVLLRLSKVLEAGGQPASDAFMKPPSTTRMASRKGYISYSNADTFIKFCREYGVLDLDLFTPVDLVEGKDLRRVCLTLRALAKKAHTRNNTAFPDFDDSTKRPGKSGDMGGASAGRIGGILDHFEGRPTAPAAATAANGSSGEEEVAAEALSENTAPDVAMLMQPSTDALASESNGGGRPLLSTRNINAEVAPAATNSRNLRSPPQAKVVGALAPGPPRASASPQRDRDRDRDPRFSSPPPSVVPSKHVAESVAQRQRQLLESVTGLPYSSLATEPPTRDIPVVAESQVVPAKERGAKAVVRSSSSSGGGRAPETKGKGGGAGEKGSSLAGRVGGPLALVAIGGVVAVLGVVTAALLVKGGGGGGRRRRSEEEDQQQQQQGPERYSVKKGDTLASISKRVGKKDWEEIVRLNPNIRNPNLIYPADVLKLKS